MLTLTENAATIIRHLALDVANASTAGLRIGARDDAPGTFLIEIVPSPDRGDQVVDAQGAHVFLDPIAWSGLADKELDATVDEGSVHFRLRTRD